MLSYIIQKNHVRQILAPFNQFKIYKQFKATVYIGG